ncbi:EXS family-domain-containing protein [Fimicolochytrium jonesii]|uniref:EXS family-domain-containing protein n=1 Tax=Fimicolochytrium jonesii TaxID=1396493 RepID=UPI0022FE466A|nr:EXS family-domain-containing protein [Fimicolochytrium jonesii]KAI8815580.1 EXS family-domain-containing protein [Fimicolochytrium jonesii]
MPLPHSQQDSRRRSPSRRSMTSTSSSPSSSSMPQPRLLLLLLLAITTYLLLTTVGPPALTLFITLPPYFRFLLLIDLGLWCWATNVHGLILSGIHVGKLLDDGSHHDHEHRDVNPRAMYGLAGVFTGVTLASLWCFRVLESGRGEEAAEIVPACTYVMLVGMVVMPGGWGWGEERERFLRSLKRTVLGTLSTPVPFCDVILADILTSFSRSMGDLKIVFTDLVTDESAAVAVVHRTTVGVGDFVQPFLICIPHLLRLRQCLAEYTQTPLHHSSHLSHTSTQTSSPSSIRARHLANAAKYVSAIPVIVAGFTINWIEGQVHGGGGDSADGGAAEGRGRKEKLDWAVGVWILFATLNSLFTLYWDIIMDWHLGNLGNLSTPVSSSPSSRRKSTHRLLRPTLHFPSPYLYYAAIAIDAVLRFSWIVRIALLRKVVDASVLDPSAGGGGDVSSGGDTDRTAKETLVAIDICLKVLEILRRWVWVFFRVEREWVVRGGDRKAGKAVAGGVSGVSLCCGLLVMDDGD